jgi:carbonic anhydrase/acetyltransferase-like protein (isoleucine patch superfamily)
MPEGGVLLPWRGKLPRVAADAFVAPGARLIGDVEVGAGASIWFGCVLRGDVYELRVGPRANLQDNTVVHVVSGGPGTYIGADVTVGHGCILHACRIQDRGFVGMGSVVLDEGVIESDAMLAAGALLTAGKRVPTGELWAGRPARKVRELRPDEIEHIRYSAERYAALAREYLASMR